MRLLLLSSIYLALNILYYNNTELPYYSEVLLYMPPAFGVILVVELLLLISSGSRIRKEFDEMKNSYEDKLSSLQTKLDEYENDNIRLREETEETREVISETKLQKEEAYEEVKTLKAALADSESKLTKEIDKRKDIQQSSMAEAEILNLLSLLQEKGRLIDFLMDDITPYNDNQVGAAARVIHQGCSSVVMEYFDIKPLHRGNEGDKITLEKNFDPQSCRLVGKVSGEPPYNGKVVHRGWQTSKITVPKSVNLKQSADFKVITPTEVEV